MRSWGFSRNPTPVLSINGEGEETNCLSQDPVYESGRDFLFTKIVLI
jgi:hypothetical protein